MVAWPHPGWSLMINQHYILCRHLCVQAAVGGNCPVIGLWLLSLLSAWLSGSLSRRSIRHSGREALWYWSLMMMVVHWWSYQITAGRHFGYARLVEDFPGNRLRVGPVCGLTSYQGQGQKRCVSGASSVWLKSFLCPMCGRIRFGEFNRGWVNYLWIWML